MPRLWPKRSRKGRSSSSRIEQPDRLGDAVVWVWEQKRALRMAARQIGRLIAHVSDDAVAFRFDRSSYRRLECDRGRIMSPFGYHVESRITLITHVAQVLLSGGSLGFGPARDEEHGHIHSTC